MGLYYVFNHISVKDYGKRNINKNKDKKTSKMTAACREAIAGVSPNLLEPKKHTEYWVTSIPSRNTREYKGPRIGTQGQSDLTVVIKQEELADVKETESNYWGCVTQCKDLRGLFYLECSVIGKQETGMYLIYTFKSHCGHWM